MFGFTGEPTDSDGLVHLRARYYNPSIGQFFSLDPLEGDMGQPMSLDRYMYVQGKVANRVDPSGLVGQTDVATWERWGGCDSAFMIAPKICDDPKNQTNDLVVDPDKQLYLFSWDVSLSVSCYASNNNVTWTGENIDNLNVAFSAINSRLLREQTSSRKGYTFNEIFGGLELRHTYGSVASAGATRSGSLVYVGPKLRTDEDRKVSNYYATDPKSNPDPKKRTAIYNPSLVADQLIAYGLDKPGNFEASKTIIHELGHVFDWRTGQDMYRSASHLPTGVQIKSIGVFIEHVITGEANEDPQLEAVADHFLNWVFDYGGRIDLAQPDKNLADDALLSAEFWLGGKDKYGLQIAGIQKWLEQASRYPRRIVI